MKKPRKKRGLRSLFCGTITIALNEDIEDGRMSTLDKSKVKTEHGAHGKRKCNALLSKFPKHIEVKQYLGVSICGLSAWACAYILLGEAVHLDGWLLGMAIVAVSGYAVGHSLERLTTVPAVVGMTVVGIAFRNLGIVSYHTHPVADTIDYHLRRIYPVIILTRGPLSWDWNYIKANYVLVFSLATLPWIVEWLTLTTATYYIMGIPWVWGIHLGSIIASVSPAVVVPTCLRFRVRGLGANRNIAKLVGCGGGLDTAFTEGMFGVINAAIFVEAPEAYRLVKGFLAMFVGVGLGVCWGVLVDWVPEHRDPFAATIKSMIILCGGVLVMYAAGVMGWGGTAGVAVMVCAATAGARWERRGWSINAHPVAEVFRVLWTIFEPMLFSFSGYYLEIDKIEPEEFVQIVGCIAAALATRLLTAFLVSLAAGGLTVLESLFVAVTWIPKAIVEAVLVRVALDSLPKNASTGDRKNAQMHVNVIVIAIVLTSTLGSALTTLLGPILLKQDLKICPAEESPESRCEETAASKRPSTA